MRFSGLMMGQAQEFLWETQIWQWMRNTKFSQLVGAVYDQDEIWPNSVYSVINESEAAKYFSSCYTLCALFNKTERCIYATVN